MSDFKTTRTGENYHEDGIAAARPDPLDDPLSPFSFKRMCAVAGQSNRLRALQEKAALLQESLRVAEDVDADGHMTPADAERRQGEAEEQGEER